MEVQEDDMEVQEEAWTYVKRLQEYTYDCFFLHSKCS